MTKLLNLARVQRMRQVSLPNIMAALTLALFIAGCAVTEPIKEDATIAVSATATPSATVSEPSAAPTTAPTTTPATTAAPAAQKPAPTAQQPAAAPPIVAAPSTTSAPSTTRPIIQPNIYDNSKLYPGTGQFVRQQPPAPPAPKGPEEFTLNFESVDIRAVTQSILGDMLRESFSIHPQTAGNVTIRLSKAVPRTELIPILESLLRQNGQVMIREDGIYKVMPAGLGTKGSLTPQVATTAAQLPNGYSVQIVQLRFAGVRDMARILEPYAVEPQSSIRVDELRNLVILSGTQRELKHMLEVIDLFDVDYLAGYSIGLFPMQTDVKALSADLDRIFGGASAGAPGAGGAAGASASPLAGIVRIVPIERLNGLLVITTQPRYLDEAKKWIDRLDKGGGMAGGVRLNVYPVQNGRADRLAQLLTEIYGNRTGGTGTGATLAPGARPVTTTTTIQGAAPGQQGAGGIGGGAGGLGAFISNLFQSSGTAVSKDTRIIADNDNNALLILASPSDYDVILSALRQLDVPRRQVMVEVLVAEVNLKDELSFGIEWFMKDPKNNITGALRNTVGDGAVLPRVPGIPAGTADLRSLIPATRGLQLINAVTGDIRGVIQMLGTDGRARLQFAPKLLVLDNEKGIVNVGSRISVSTGTNTGTGTGGNTVTTFQYIDTGVLLTVTPRINAGGRVTMEINQEVSSANRAVTGNNNPDIDNRKAQTTVNVASGETMILAGLIREQNDFATSGVPFLSKIPVIGGLFGTQTRNTTRTELVVMITPTVITSNDEARAVTDELRKKLPGLESLIPKKTVVTVEEK
jgi:general secretion pathway protein D